MEPIGSSVSFRQTNPNETDIQVLVANQRPQSGMPVLLEALLSFCQIFQACGHGVVGLHPAVKK